MNLILEFAQLLVIANNLVTSNQVEPVYGRELLRNYKDDSKKEQDEDLKQLLESLKSSDVVPVKHKKLSTKIINDEEHTNSKQHKVSMLDSDNLTGERNYRFTKSPPKIKSHFSKNSSYIPSFARNNNSVSNGPIVARRLLIGDSDHTKTETIKQPYNRHDNRLIKQMSAEGNVKSKTHAANNSKEDFLKTSTFGTHETLNLSSKPDFSTRVLESFSDLKLSPSPRLISKVQSLPELKSEALLVGAKKALHERAGFGAYVPSQLSNRPKSKLQVRTDWKAKYLK